MNLKALTIKIMRGEIISLKREKMPTNQIRTTVITLDDIHHVVYTSFCLDSVMVDAAFSGSFMRPFDGSISLDDVTAFWAAAHHYVDNH